MLFSREEGAEAEKKPDGKQGERQLFQSKIRT